MEKIGFRNTECGLSLAPFDASPLRQGNHRGDGVVLRRMDTSSSSGGRLLFLRDMGALWVGAPGPRARFGGAAEPMIWGRFVLYRGPRRLYLKSVDVAEDFLSVRKSRKSLLRAAGWCRELGKRLPLGYENNAVLSLFWGCMSGLSKGLCASLLGVRFAWRWGNIWGVAPSLERCPECGALLDPDMPAALSEAGFLCVACRAAGASRPDAAYVRLVSPEVFGIIKSACLSPAAVFAGMEPENRARLSSGCAVEDVDHIASHLLSFLTFIM